MLGGWKCDASGPGTGQGPLCRHLLPFLPFLWLSPSATPPFTSSWSLYLLALVFVFLPPTISSLSFLPCIFSVLRPEFVTWQEDASYCNTSSFVCVNAHCVLPFSSALLPGCKLSVTQALDSIITVQCSQAFGSRIEQHQVVACSSINSSSSTANCLQACESFRASDLQ